MKLLVTAAFLSFSFLTLPAFAVTTWRAAPDANSISWAVDMGKGSLLQGHCGTFTSNIAFDPADLAHSNVDIVINMNSCRTGVADNDAMLPNSEWFNESAFPKAEFKAQKFRLFGGNRYAADGMLTLKGATKPLALNFTVDINGADAHAKGSAVIQRMDFGVGRSTSGDYAGLAVNVKIDLKASKK